MSGSTFFVGKVPLEVVEDRRPNTSELLPLDQYDLFIVSFSGGKDSLAALLDLLDRGVPKHKIELWHQDVDGESQDGLMDWPVTRAYCVAVANALGIKIRFQYKVGGFEREMNRHNSLTAPTRFQLGDGTWKEVGGVLGKKSTRRKFPQTSADLSVRWCSSYLKIDVASIAINNDPVLRTLRICYISGERREESASRSRYAEIEKHRTSKGTRRVDQWRNVIDWSEERVWAIIKRYGVVPHPAYLLGWGRLSCMSCIFGGADQWASVRAIAPAKFARIAAYEAEFGVTIKRGKTVVQMADAGTPYAETQNASLVALAMSHEYTNQILIDDWTLPAGAYKRTGGPI